MPKDNDAFSSVSSIIDELVVAQTTNDDDNEIEKLNELLAKLHTQLTSRKDGLQTSSILDKLEQCFVKLSRLSSISSLSSSPLLHGC